MGFWKLALDLWNKAGFRFSDDWNKHVDETKKARKRYLAMFPGLRTYIRNRIGEVTETQQVVSPTGRVRHLPHHGEDSEGFWHIKNSAVNFPIQSFAFDVIGSGLIDYEQALLKEHKMSYRDWHLALLERPWDPPASPVFNQVHDECDLDLHPKTGKRDLEILVDAMRNCRSLKKLVPEFDLTLNCDVQIVSNWGQAK
jgi:DNA polymerase I-like protein with 3'-5' exonuclease and polymerase domains